mmetsp:Transcript_26668/g.36735  ORF Transcript_26668/g.36735 Transcript_26668/m.36735 type:complete len:151 (-) Transcript_26668:1564-2016(-)
MTADTISYIYGEIRSKFPIHDAEKCLPFITELVEGKIDDTNTAQAVKNHYKEILKESIGKVSEDEIEKVRNRLQTILWTAVVIFKKLPETESSVEFSSNNSSLKVVTNIDEFSDEALFQGLKSSEVDRLVKFRNIVAISIKKVSDHGNCK